MQQFFKKLFIEPTAKPFIQFFRYVFVGGCSFLVDAGVLWLCVRAGLYYLIAAIVGFIAGLIINFFLSRALVFRAQEARVGRVFEFVAYALIGLIGLGLTEALLYFFTDILHVFYMISKVIASAIVLFWNFLARKLLLYRGAPKP
ncbi:MAG: GtrA family protein [Eubacteriales bacterium]|nr:GtrA family protein [Eubacteriales bacterium]